MFGASFYNDSGETVIDSNYQNYLLVAQGSTNTSGNTYVTLPGTLKWEDCIVFVSTVPSDTHSVRPFVSSDRRSFALRGYSDWNTAANFTIQYRVYAISSLAVSAAVAQGTFGMRVIREDGSVSFDSRLPALEIVDRFTFYYSSNGTGNTSKHTANPNSLSYTPWCSLHTAGYRRMLMVQDTVGHLLGVCPAPRPGKLLFNQVSTASGAALNPVGYEVEYTFLTTK